MWRGPTRSERSEARALLAVTSAACPASGSPANSVTGRPLGGAPTMAHSGLLGSQAPNGDVFTVEGTSDEVESKLSDAARSGQSRLAWFAAYGTDGSLGVNPVHVATLKVSEISDCVARAGPFFVASVRVEPPRPIERRARARMLVAELQELEEVKTLLTKGQQLGVLTFGDVASAVSEVDLDESDVEDLYGHLERQGIELVEDVDPAQKTAPDAEPSDG